MGKGRHTRKSSGLPEIQTDAQQVREHVSVRHRASTSQTRDNGLADQ